MSFGKEQKKEYQILDNSQAEAVNAEEMKVVVVAEAGSGKTTCAIEAIVKYRKEHPSERICFITYTRAAKEEMENRLCNRDIHDVEVTTIHVWSRNQLKELENKFNFKMKILEEPDIKAILKEIVTKQGKKINIDILYTYITGSKRMDVTESYLRTLEFFCNVYIKYKAFKKLYDFTDYPLYLYDKLVEYKEFITSIDALFVDELQDVDEIQSQLFLRTICQKKFFIGDPKQCQPKGTKIQMSDNTFKNIEDIKIGDKVRGFNLRTKEKEICEVEDAVFSGEVNRIVKVQLYNHYRSFYSVNHRCLVSINEDETLNAVFLTWSEKYGFHIGKINGYNFLTNATKIFEKLKVEKLWILKVFNSSEKAVKFLTDIAYQYRIPQASFTSLDFLDFSSFFDPPRGKELLLDYNLHFDLPFLDIYNLTFSQDKEIITYAINLKSSLMACYISNRKKPAIISKVNIIFQKTPVYSLQISKNNFYIGDGIVTHNSIYIFRGADEEIFYKNVGFEEKKLEYNYRSYQEIIDFAQTAYFSIKTCLQGQRQNGDEKYETMIETVQNFNTFLIFIINRMFPSDITCVRGRGAEIYTISPFGMINTLSGKKLNNGVEVVKQFFDYSGSIMILCRTNKQVKEIENLGYRNVSTIHQAKGLEYDNIILIDSEIKTLEDLNVSYVGMTRAKNNLLITNFYQLTNYMSKIIKTAF